MWKQVWPGTVTSLVLDLISLLIWLSWLFCLFQLLLRLWLMGVCIQYKSSVFSAAQAGFLVLCLGH